MGRAGGGVQVGETLASARRSRGGISGHGVPQGPPIIKLREHTLFAASSVHPKVTPPVTTFERASGGYPVLLRPGRASLDAQLWDMLVRNGATYRVRTLSKLLWARGVGTRALSKGVANRPIGEERLREELHAFAFAYRVPLGSDVADDDGHRGFGLLRSRDECRRYAEQRMGRHGRQLSSLQGLRRGAPMWFEFGPSAQTDWPCPGVPDEQRDIVLGRLSGGGYVKGSDLTRALFVRELAGLEGENLEKAIEDHAPVMRKVVSAMREAGVPITGDPARGYRLVSSVDAVEAYIAEETEGRLSAVLEGAPRTLLSGALWYPETDEEREAAEQWRAELHAADIAPSSVRRVQRGNDRKRQAENKVAAVKRAAADKERALMASPHYANLKHKNMAGLVLTRTEKELAQTLVAVRKTKKTGKGAAAAGL